jgi:hypothetical protein
VKALELSHRNERRSRREGGGDVAKRTLLELIARFGFVGAAEVFSHRFRQFLLILGFFWRRRRFEGSNLELLANEVARSIRKALFQGLGTSTGAIFLEIF